VTVVVCDLALTIFVDTTATASRLTASPSDPLLPATRIESVPGKGLQSTGLVKNPWRTPSPIRDILKKALSAAGLRYYRPHSFRHLLASLAKEHCTTL
jgi:integrase/recombinase XerD